MSLWSNTLELGSLNEIGDEMMQGTGQDYYRW